MSGAACVIIIDEARRLANTAKTVVALFSMEMAREVTITPEWRQALSAALIKADDELRRALDQAIRTSGPPHDDVLRGDLASFLSTWKGSRRVEIPREET